MRFLLSHAVHAHHTQLVHINIHTQHAQQTHSHTHTSHAHTLTHSPPSTHTHTLTGLGRPSSGRAAGPIRS